MKRLSKIKTKKGFTLLETLLATCILVIIGSMLMEGFITAMGYSYNSSVYSRSAAYNSKLCVEKLAVWSRNADGVAGVSVAIDGTITTTAEDYPYRAVGTRGYNETGGYLNLKQITFTGGLGTVRIATWNETNVNDTLSANNLSKFSAETIKGNTNAVADNRIIFFYYPTVNGQPGDSYFGNTHVYLKDGTTLVWGYDDPSQTDTDGVYILGEKEKVQPENANSNNDAENDEAAG